MTPTPEQLAHRMEVADWIEANPTGFDMENYGVMIRRPRRGADAWKP